MKKQLACCLSLLIILFGVVLNVCAEQPLQTEKLKRNEGSNSGTPITIRGDEPSPNPVPVVGPIDLELLPYEVGDTRWAELILSFELGRDKDGKEILDYYFGETLEIHWKLTYRGVSKTSIFLSDNYFCEFEPRFFKDGLAVRGNRLPGWQGWKWAVENMIPEEHQQPTSQLGMPKVDSSNIIYVQQGQVTEGVISGRLVQKLYENLWLNKPSGFGSGFTKKNVAKKEVFYETPNFSSVFTPGKGRYLLFLVYSPHVILNQLRNHVPVENPWVRRIASEGKWINIFDKERPAE